MTQAQLEELKADFLEWTGGFEPESEEECLNYIQTSMPFNLAVEEAADALRRWVHETVTPEAG